MTKKRDSGNLSIDFLVGFTIFILAFIWVVSLIPGMLIGLQSYTIDYDAVAYRTGVILVEDPGEPALPQVPWELDDKRDVVRFGLAISKGTPNLLSEDKVNRFFCSTVFSYPDDYQKRAIFGDYPYQFNISLWDIKENKSYFVGDSLSNSYGTIRRLVQIKGNSNATINGSQIDPEFINGDNETQHEFTILINNTKLLNAAVRNPAYQINPANEPLVVNITHINSTMFADRANCFNIGLTKIYAKDENHIPIQLFYDPIIDGIQEHVNTESDYAGLPFVNDNLSLFMYPSYLPWSNYPQVYLTLTFNLTGKYAECGPTIFSGTDPVRGSQFLNNTFTYPFEYDYNTTNVTQSNLRDAVIEVNVGSGYRTQTGTVVQGLNADFDYIFSGGTTVQFNDRSTGSPTEWEWQYWNLTNTTPTTFGTSSLQSNTFPAQGAYTVQLKVTDNAGNTASATKNIMLSAPVVSFSGIPTLGGAPLLVGFTDTSSGTPTSWKWEYNKTQMATINWVQFSAVKNPGQSFPAGTYDIRLTATNAVGSNTLIIPGYISAIAMPVADFTTNQTSGVVSLPVKFTDTSTNTPTSWNWEFNKTSGGAWTAFNTPAAQNPTQTFPTGIYDIRLTVTNTGGSNTITKFGHITVTAVPITHIISATTVGGGTLAPTGAVIVNHGGSQTFSITPIAGNHITSVLIDGVSNGTISSYTFTNVIVDHTISATFAANAPQILYYNDFESIAKLNQWTLSSATNVIRNSGGSCQNPLSNLRNCTGSAQILNKAWMQKTIPTSGYTTITVSYNLGVSSLTGIQNIKAQWRPDGSSPWITLRTITHSSADDNGHLNFYSDVLPITADNQANFALQFILSPDTGASDYGYVDDVKVIGTHV